MNVAARLESATDANGIWYLRQYACAGYGGSGTKRELLDEEN